jgi:CHAT domain-containing protein
MQLSSALLSDVKLAADTKLYVAPDGVLQYLPFELLSLPGQGALLNATTISYLPSASALAWLRARTPSPDLELLAFGDVPARGADPRAPADALLTDFVLPPLTETARELAAAQRSLPGRQQVLTGAAASEGAWHSSAGQSVAVVHVAAHALVDERPGRGAAILLAADEREDGLLHPDEIVADRHPAALTILAACHSAADVLENGRALGSLTGAFLAAGSNAVIATLWDVDDTTTAAFMEQLYYEIGQGSPAAEALRRVKVRLSGDPRWSNPSSWSGYVLIGDAHSPLVRGSVLTRIVIAALLLLALAISAWLWARRRREASESQRLSAG